MKFRVGEQEVGFWAGHYGPQVLNEGTIMVDLLRKS